MAHSEFFSNLPRLVLASTSPRRASLLSQIGLTFEVCPSDVEEPLLSGSAAEVTQKLALLKAEAVERQYADAIIIGADTLVSLEGELLGKPTDDAHAREMLLRLSGSRHEVVTGVALIVADSSGRRGLQSCTVSREIVWTETTNVYFRELRSTEIAAYIASGEASDKAGAYGIQGRGAAFVKRVEGCYFNVVGLPLASLVEQLWRLTEKAA